MNKYSKSGVIKTSAVFDPIYHVACRKVPWNVTF